MTDQCTCNPCTCAPTCNCAGCACGPACQCTPACDCAQTSLQTSAPAES